MKKVKFSRNKWTGEMLALPTEQDARFIIDYDSFYEDSSKFYKSKNGYYVFFDKKKSTTKYIWSSWNKQYYWEDP